MLADVDISAPASLIGDPTRAVFLMALSEGQSLPAGELARRAGVTASTASIQLAKLVGGGLLTVEQHGRHRYYSLADPAIAAAIESLAVIAPRRPASSLRQARIGSDLQAARTCYDHLAGALGVALFDALLRKGVLTPDLEATSRARDGSATSASTSKRPRRAGGRSRGAASTGASGATTSPARSALRSQPASSSSNGSSERPPVAPFASPRAAAPGSRANSRSGSGSSKGSPQRTPNGVY